jgi:hypothetical protein
MTEHPSEAELQEFALGETKNETGINAHIQLCDECKIAIANYRILFSAIATEEKPAFDSDFSALVLEKIQPANAVYSRDRLIFYIGFAVIGLLGIGCYWYRGFLSGLLIGFGSMFMYLLLATAITVLVFQAMDIYKRYQHKIKSLDFY